MKTRLLGALVGLAIGFAVPTFAQQKDTAAHAGRVLAFSFQSKTLGRDWPYNVYLPDGYDKSNLRYPVLFLLHGFNQDESTWVSEGKINEVADQEIAAGNIAPLLLVMPGSGNNWYVDTKEKIETAFVNDFIPEIERKFRILSEREGRAIGGDSMGGYGAFRFILKYPERFSVALLVAPSIFVPEPPVNSPSRQGTSSVILLMRKSGNAKTIHRCSTRSLLKIFRLPFTSLLGTMTTTESSLKLVRSTK